MWFGIFGLKSGVMVISICFIEVKCVVLEVFFLIGWVSTCWFLVSLCVGAIFWLSKFWFFMRRCWFLCRRSEVCSWMFIFLLWSVVVMIFGEMLSVNFSLFDVVGMWSSICFMIEECSLDCVWVDVRSLF